MQGMKNVIVLVLLLMLTVIIPFVIALEAARKTVVLFLHQKEWHHTPKARVIDRPTSVPKLRNTSNLMSYVREGLSARICKPISDKYLMMKAYLLCMIYRCFNYATAPSLRSRQQRLHRRNHTSYFFMIYQMAMMCEACVASSAASQAMTRASSEGEFPYSQGQDATCQFEQALKHGWRVPPWEEPPDRFCARPPQVRGSGQDKVVPKMVRASPKLHWRADRFF